MNQFDLPDLSELGPALFALAPALLLVIVGVFTARLLVRRALRALAHHSRLSERDTAPLAHILNVLILIVGLALVLNVAGVNLGGLWTVFSTVLAMVAIGFVAVWSVLSNTLCTVVILIARPFSIGDEVEFVGEPTKGRVADLNFIFTTLETEDGAQIRVPNNLFFQKVLKRRPGARAESNSLADRLKRPQAAA